MNWTMQEWLTAWFRHRPDKIKRLTLSLYRKLHKKSIYDLFKLKVSRKNILLEFGRTK